MDVRHFESERPGGVDQGWRGVTVRRRRSLDARSQRRRAMRGLGQGLASRDGLVTRLETADMLLPGPEGMSAVSRTGERRRCSGGGAAAGVAAWPGFRLRRVSSWSGRSRCRGWAIAEAGVRRGRDRALLNRRTCIRAGRGGVDGQEEVAVVRSCGAGRGAALVRRWRWCGAGAALPAVRSCGAGRGAALVRRWPWCGAGAALPAVRWWGAGRGAALAVGRPGGGAAGGRRWCGAGGGAALERRWRWCGAGGGAALGRRWRWCGAGGGALVRRWRRCGAGAALAVVRRWCGAGRGAALGWRWGWRELVDGGPDAVGGGRRGGCGCGGSGGRDGVGSRSAGRGRFSR